MRGRKKGAQRHCPKEQHELRKTNFRLRALPAPPPRRGMQLDQPRRTTPSSPPPVAHGAHTAAPKFPTQQVPNPPFHSPRPPTTLQATLPRRATSPVDLPTNCDPDSRARAPLSEERSRIRNSCCARVARRPSRHYDPLRRPMGAQGRGRLGTEPTETAERLVAPHVGRGRPNEHQEGSGAFPPKTPSCGGFCVALGRVAARGWARTRSFQGPGSWYNRLASKFCVGQLATRTQGGLSCLFGCWPALGERSILVGNGGAAVGGCPCQRAGVLAACSAELVESAAAPGPQQG